MFNHSDRLAYINGTVDSILSLDSELRLSIAHCLMVRLEANKDITRWQFWSRYAVAEQAESIVEHKISNEGLDIIMQKLSEKWNEVSSSTQETDSITYEIAKVTGNRN